MPTPKNTTVFIIAGESSGDAHASELIQSVVRQNNHVRFRGVGGAQMKQAGAEILVDCQRIAVVGLDGLFRALPLLYRTYRWIENEFRNKLPDLVVLVDYPGFNLKIAKLAKRYGIKVLYYISPQIWAWRKGRIKKIRRYVDQMAVILPFEVQVFQNAHVPVEFVGHPTVDAIQPRMTIERARQYFQMPETKRVVALIPGSRAHEVKRMLPLYLETASNLSQKDSSIHFILTLAPGIDRMQIENGLKRYPHLSIQCIEEDRFEALQLASAAIVTSGTATLETALLGIPLAVVYKVSPLTYWIGRMVVKTQFIGLCNLVAEEEVAPEFIQKEATPQALGHFVEGILNDDDYALKKKHQLKRLRANLPGVSESASIGPLVLKMLGDGSALFH